MKRILKWTLIGLAAAGCCAATGLGGAPRDRLRL